MNGSVLSFTTSGEDSVPGHIFSFPANGNFRTQNTLKAHKRRLL
jgi:hypothetical protein